MAKVKGFVFFNQVALNLSSDLTKDGWYLNTHKGSHLQLQHTDSA